VQTEEYAAARLLHATADPRIGTFSHIGAVALNMILDADIHVGETVAVFGLGVPGQLVAQLARLNGARVIAVDGIGPRRDLAGSLGADEVLDPLEGNVAEHIRDLTGGRGADVCLEISGSYAALHEAVRSVAHDSRVCVGGFFQGGADRLRLGEEFHHNRVQLIGSQISGVSPAVQHRWDRYRLTTTVIRLADTGRLQALSLITHTFAVERVADAYELLDQRPGDALQVLLAFATDEPQ
jgi:threonine dehydrogenase-like Zn-dependent dehydrogenase